MIHLSTINFPLVSRLLDFLFPAHCVGCKKASTWLCLDCLSNLPRVRESNLTHIVAAFPYNDKRVRKAIWLLKYKRVVEIAASLAQAMYEAVIEEMSEIRAYRPEKKKILIIPVPLSKKRLRKRGFNQALELARNLAAFNPDQFKLEEKLVRKVKETPTQVSVKNKRERLENLKEAFFLNSKGKLKGASVIIVDDVATTGSTIGEIRKILLKAGAKKVIGLVVAHGH